VSPESSGFLLDVYSALYPAGGIGRSTARAKISVAPSTVPRRRLRLTIFNSTTEPEAVPRNFFVASGYSFRVSSIRDFRLSGVAKV
jgi:hypothetical protein